MLRATTACTFSTSERPKVVRTTSVFCTFDLEMCFAPQRRPLFNLSTSKSALNVVCFVHFAFEMCFAPQRRTLFPHQNFSKVFRTRQFLTLLPWKSTSRHNGVHFFDISISKSGQRLSVSNTLDLEMCFAHLRAALARLLFDPLEPQIIGQHGES